MYLYRASTKNVCNANTIVSFNKIFPIVQSCHVQIYSVDTEMKRQKRRQKRDLKHNEEQLGAFNLTLKKNKHSQEGI